MGEWAKVLFFIMESRGRRRQCENSSNLLNNDRSQRRVVSKACSAKMVRFTDRPDMTIAVDWAVKPHVEITF